MRVSLARSNPSLAHDDYTCGTAVHAKTATGAHIFVHNEYNMVHWVGSRLVCVYRFGDGVGGKHVNALPRANINAPFAHDAFGLIDMQKLLWFDGFG